MQHVIFMESYQIGLAITQVGKKGSPPSSGHWSDSPRVGFLVKFCEDDMLSF
jgi:hypothetical protein